MKKIVFLLAIALTAGFTQANAQTQALKLGYVNSQELLSMMPEATQADTTLSRYTRALGEQYQTMLQEGQTKMEEYQSKKDTWTAAVRETKERAINDLQNRVQEFQVSAQDSIQAKKAQLFKPLLDKAQKAIQDVGAEGNYDYIFDGSSLLYAKDAQNLLPKVKAKLGIK